MRRYLSGVSSPRPFRVLGLQQIAVGTLSKSSAKKLWVECLGLPQVGTFQSVKENVDEDILHLGPPGSVWGVEVDVMQPLDPQASPRVHDPALNHIGLWVDKLPEAVTWLSAQGVRFAPGGIRKGAGGHDVTFMHPKGNEAFPIGGGGVLIELVQAPKEVIEGYDRECSSTTTGSGSAIKQPTLQ